MNGGTGLSAGFAQVEFLLQTNPELRTRAEITTQAQGSVGCDRPATMHDGGHPAVRNLQGKGQTVLGDSHGFEKLFLKNLPGMGEMQGGVRHVS